MAVANQKGGVGKTTTTLELAAAAHAGRQVLVDLGPTGQRLHRAGGQRRRLHQQRRAICQPHRLRRRRGAPHRLGEQVACIPASLPLAKWETDPTLSIEFRLRKALAGVDGFDLCLLDCPPSLGRLVINVLVITTVFDTVAVVGKHCNPGLTVAGVVVNQVPTRSREADYRLAELTGVLGEAVWRTITPTRVVIAEAIGAAAPIHDFASRARDVIAIFAALTDQLLALAPRR